MNKLDIFDHEDAFSSANRHAQEVVGIAEKLKNAANEDEAKAAIAVGQVKHQELFTAFIAGVDYGRKNPEPGSLR